MTTPTHYTQKLHAGTAFPAISVKTLDDKTITLGQPLGHLASDLPIWQLIVVYRGQHCPMCTEYLNTLNHHVQDLADIAIEVVAVSADNKAQLDDYLTRTDKHHLEAPNYPIAYGLSEDHLLTLGAYISRPRSEKETDHPFAEPALFVINEHGTIQVVDYSNNPFVRPELATLIRGLKWIRKPENNYPIRGTYPDAQKS